MPIGTRAVPTYWQDWANLLLGGWLFVSPWVLGFAEAPAPAWNSWVLGVVVALISLAALIQFAEWEEYVNAIIGVWLVISPWVMGFTDWSGALWNHIVVGVLVAALSLWDALSHKDWEKGVA